MQSRLFNKKLVVSDIADNILKKRYYQDNEASFLQLTKRVVDYITDHNREIYYNLLGNGYFVPNSPTLVNAGKDGAGLSACYVVDFPDTIEGIYKTKLDFALIARKGGGCGTTLNKLRPKNSIVSGSSHGYSGGPVDFYNTICNDMEVMTQSGFRKMAQMGVLEIRHPDILRFLFAKYEEGKMTTTNLSIMVDDKFMNKLESSPDSYHKVYHKKWGSGYLVYSKDENKYFPVVDTVENLEKNKSKILTVSELFAFIYESAWRNGEPKLIWAHI